MILIVYVQYICKKNACTTTVEVLRGAQLRGNRREGHYETNTCIRISIIIIIVIIIILLLL